MSLLAVVLLLGTSGCAAYDAPAKISSTQAVTDFVQQFYDWYVAESVETDDAPVWNVVLKQKREDLSITLLRAMELDSAAQAHASGIIVGLDFDPFLNTQDPCDHYKAGPATSLGNQYRVDIYSVCSGKVSNGPVVVAQITRNAGSFVFTNFFYPAIHQDLLGILNTLHRERNQ